MTSEACRSAASHRDPTSDARHSLPDTTGRLKRWSGRSRRDFLVFLALALPNLLLIAVFTYRPAVQQPLFLYAELDAGLSVGPVVGLGNYVTSLPPGSASKVLTTTAIFTAATVGGSLLLGLVVALALTRKSGRRVRAGHGLRPVRPVRRRRRASCGCSSSTRLRCPRPGSCEASACTAPSGSTISTLALVMVIIVYVWKNLGYCAGIYLAGLQAVPQDLLEAAASTAPSVAALRHGVPAAAVARLRSSC